MEGLYFRLATLEDLSILLEFEQNIITAERPYNETLQSDPISYYDIEAMIGTTDTDVVVAVIDGELIASAYITIRPAKPYVKHEYYAYLGFMYTKPKYRGKGINGELINELKKMASAKGISELRLDVYQDNHAAVRAYEKAGFSKLLVNMRLEI